MAMDKLSANAILNRLAFGPDQSSLESISQKGYPAWLEEQLHPDHSKDALCNQRIVDFTLPMKYAESKDGYWPAVDEARPFQWLNASSTDLMTLIEPGKHIPGQEQVRPRQEVMCATLIRSVYSHWQLQEVLADYWHNHFSVNAWEGMASLMLPIYDREVIRPHIFGNFRQLLEAVAKSAAMQSYLNNRSSRAGAPNENYARELFELHTLGSPAYLNTLYNRWRDVPGATKGKPDGYIDQDVYEAARAFTGWTIADGTGLGGGINLPRTGEFAYVDAWHDQYQKRILAMELDPYQRPMSDGLMVLDLTAYHPATAQFICHKLCTRLLSDNPPEKLVKSSTSIWIANQHHPRQISKVIEHIALSLQFAQSESTKVKRPMEVMASFIRATGQDFKPTIGLINHLNACGQPLFGWTTPNGLPDVNERWLGANALWQRWNLLAGLTDNWWQCGNLDAFELIGVKNIPVEQFTDLCLKRMSGQNIDPINLINQLVKASGIKPGAPLTNPAIAKRILAWIAMLPEFQLR